MGGNAFAGLKRLSSKDYKEYELDVCSKFVKHFGKLEPTKYFKSKNSFGDLDIVVMKPQGFLDKNFLRLVLDSEFSLNILNRDQVYVNKDIVSFRYMNFQVDLIFVDPQFFETAKFYFAYNDLNNFIGRIAHKFGVKFGWDGLTYQIRTDSGHNFKKIQLSLDPKEIYSFLDLSYSRYEQGFNDLEEIFEFVSSSKYFNPEIYSYDNLNHINRTRNKKRQSYQSFMDWLETNPRFKEVGYNPYTFIPDKSSYLIKIHNSFPNSSLLNKLLAYAEELAFIDLQKSKFNGNLVMGWTGLQGRDLGSCLNYFKKWVIERYHSTWEDFLKVMRPEDVKSLFQEEFYPTWRQGL